MGSSLLQFLKVRFDEAVARASLKWFDLRDIPAIRGDLPVGVSSLRFSSNFGTSSPKDPTLLADTDLSPLIPIT
jgi:hypothetical protein